MPGFAKISLLLVFLYALPSSAQDTIFWNKDLLLSWKDFQGVPEEGGFESAAAATGVGMKFRYEKTWGFSAWTYKYEVRSYFIPKLSWAKAKDLNSYLLAHEQTHFNISELYARKIDKEMQQLKPSKKIQEQALEIYHRLEALHASTQKKYDRETQHSLNIDKELEWQEKIADSLKLYHDR